MEAFFKPGSVTLRNWPPELLLEPQFTPCFASPSPQKHLYLLADVLPLQQKLREGLVCQEALGGGLHQQLDGTGDAGQRGEEQRGIFQAVVADSIYLQSNHVFGHHLSKDIRGDGAGSGNSKVAQKSTQLRE